MSKKPRRSPTPRDREHEVLIDDRTGRVDIAEADALAAVRSWFELEAEWKRTQ